MGHLKTFTFKLGEIGPRAWRAKFKEALRTGIPYDGSHQLLFGSIESMMSVITRARLEAFATIVELRPDSIQQLAKHLKKDLGNISRDVAFLEGIGLIECTKEGRRLRPRAKYNQIALDFTFSAKRKGKAG